MNSYKDKLIGFSREKVHLDGYITMHLTLEFRPLTRIVKVNFLVVNCPLAYNVILGRLTLNKIKAIVSIALLTVKFLSDNGRIIMVTANQAALNVITMLALKLLGARTRKR